ncbi:putative general secretion pathway protein L, GspL (plasmid) [Ensifer adhaerens OV14]|nr:putative general secretion pathway protein L, GspL [Ensifer adhaerens OV14]
MGVLQDFWEWWVTELKSIRRPALPKAECTPVLKILRGTSQLLSAGSVMADFAPDEFGHSEFASTKRPEFHLLLGEGRFILRKISERRLPRSRLMEMAVIDLVDRTPFRTEDVNVAPVGLGDGAYYLVVRKDILEPWLATALPFAGARAAGLGLEIDGEPLWLPQDVARMIDKRIARRGWRQIVPALTFGLVLLLSFVTFSHLAWRNAVAATSLDEKVSQYRDDAIKIRKALDDRARALTAIETARLRKAQAVPFARVWEELTKTLPDTAYLTDLSLDGNVVTFSGFAQSAAQLIPLLAASQTFASPVLTGPVSRVPGRTGEQFQIKASVGRQ